MGIDQYLNDLQFYNGPIIDKPMGESSIIYQKRSAIWKISMTGAFGALISCIVDLSRNSGTVLSIQQNFFENFLNITPQFSGYLTIFLMFVLGFLFCALYKPTTIVDGFSRGFSVFALFTVVSTTQPSESSQPEGIDIGKNLEFGLINSVYASDFSLNKQQNSIQQFKPNATVIENKFISTCKPEYQGVFGLRSFMNNTVKVCKTGYSLSPGDRIEILDHWDTGFRGHRYIKILYKHDNEIKPGWIWSGQKPDYWIAVKKD